MIPKKFGQVSKLDSIIDKNDQLISIFVKSIKTAKSKQKAS